MNRKRQAAASPMGTVNHAISTQRPPTSAWAGERYA